MVAGDDGRVAVAQETTRRVSACSTRWEDARVADDDGAGALAVYPTRSGSLGWTRSARAAATQRDSRAQAGGQPISRKVVEVTWITIQATTA